MSKDGKRLSINPKGLKPCCLRTLQDYDGPQDEGTAILCRVCDQHLTVMAGHWGAPDAHS